VELSLRFYISHWWISCHNGHHWKPTDKTCRANYRWYLFAMDLFSGIEDVFVE